MVYVYTLILLAKMANTGLIRCEVRSRSSSPSRVKDPCADATPSSQLQVLTEEYEAGRSLDVPQRLVNGAKLGRLLELGSSFLDAIAPTPSHPARKHARMLKAIHTAGTIGQIAPLDPELFAYRPSDSTSPTAASNGAPAPHAVAPNASPNAEPQFDLPSIFSNSSSGPAMNDVRGIAADNEPGLALASILGGISPSYFGGDLGFFDGMWSGGEGVEGMAVDWDSLEKSMAQNPAPVFQPLDPTGYFGVK